MLIDAKYRVLANLGSGSGGTVYKVKDKLTNDILALKLCSSKKFEKLNLLKSDFFTLRNLNHPNIVRVVDFKRTSDDKCHFTMEFIDGENIFNFFKKRKELDAIYPVLAQVLNGLSYIHNKGLVHSDIKPENILVSISKDDKATLKGNLEVKLLDFGLARGLTAPADIRGTLSYIAPEVLQCGRGDRRSDLYSLGMVLYEILANRRIAYTLNKLPLVERDIPDEFLAIVTKLIKKEPEKRYYSVGEVIEDLSQIYPSLPEIEVKPSTLSSPTIGRERELFRLYELAEKAKTEGQIVFISGERGIGKSRILQEFKFECQKKDIFVTYIRCGERENRPFALLKRIFEESQLPMRIFTTKSSLSGESAKFKIFEEASNQLRKLSKKHHPLTVLVDDIELADNLSIEFLAYFSYELNENGILFVGTFEDEKSLSPIFEKIKGEKFLIEMELKKLDLSQTISMVSYILSSKDLNNIGEWVYGKTGGNPLFIEQTVEHLLKSNILIKKIDGWHLEIERLEEIRPVLSIEDAIDVMLKNLEQDEIEFLKSAAIMGERFNIDVLHKFLGLDEPTFFTLLNRLRIKDIIREDAQSNYAFSHGWMRNILYAKIDNREVLHKKVFSLSKDDPQADNVSLAYQSLKGGLREEAYDYLVKAGKEAKGNYANESALKYFKEALNIKESSTIYESIGDICSITGAYEEALRNYNFALKNKPDSQIYLKIGRVYRNRGDLKNAISYFDKGLIESPLSKSHIEILNEKVWTYLQKSDFPKALKYCTEAKEKAEKFKDKPLLADIYHNMGEIAFRKNNYEEAEGYFRESIKIKKTFKDDYKIALSYNNLAILFWRKGDLKIAEKYYKISLGLMRKIGHIKMTAIANSNLGIIYRNMWEWDKAVDCYEKSCDIFKKIGDKKSLAIVYNNIASIYHYKTNWNKAIECYEKSLKIREELEDERSIAVVLNNLANVYIEIDEPDKAKRYIDKALKLRKKANDLNGMAYSLLTLSLYYESMKDWKDSKKTLNQSLRLFKKTNNKSGVASVYSSFARIYQDSAKSEEYAKKAYRLFKNLKDEWEIGKIKRIRGMIYAAKDEGNRAESSFKESEEIFRKLRVEYELARTLFESAKFNLKRWEKKREPAELKTAYSHLKEAEEIFQRLELNKKFEEIHSLYRETLDEISLAYIPSITRKDQLNILYEVSKVINSILNLQSLFNTVINLVINLFNAERGVLLLFDEKTGTLRLRAGKKIDDVTIKDAARLSKSVIEQVAEKGEPIICEDARNDPRFKNRKSVILHNIRSLLCVPIKIRGSIIGTIYIDSSLSKNIFTKEDRDFFIALANLIGVAIENARFHRDLEKESTYLKRKMTKRHSFHNLVGGSEKMQDLYNTIEVVANTDSTVLIEGETGTGKELVAMALHYSSKRRDDIFIPVSCRAIPETLLESELFGHSKGAFTGAIRDRKGLFEEATNGTIFLDEIGDAPLSIQAKLLRVLEQREIRRVGENVSRRVDTRVICATAKNLVEEVKKGNFRDDIFFRLNVVRVRIPPLRERKDDILLLAKYFQKLYSKKIGSSVRSFTNDAIELLLNYDWPGNVRELEKSIERACIFAEGPKITAKDIKLVGLETEELKTLKEAKVTMEKKMVRNALLKTKGNVAKASRELDIKRQQLQRLIKRYEL